MQHKIPGFKVLMIYDVPMGCVLNKDNYKNYPLIESGSWLSDDSNWMIQTKWDDKNIYQLLPLTQEMMRIFFNKYSEVEGTIQRILETIKQF